MLPESRHELERLPQVQARVGLSATTIWRLRRAHAFPKDPGNRIKDLDFQTFYERALVALGHPADEDREPFSTLTALADDVAVRAYLVGVAVGQRISR